jgi:hypothetical protein
MDLFFLIALTTLSAYGTVLGFWPPKLAPGQRGPVLTDDTDDTV